MDKVIDTNELPGQQIVFRGCTGRVAAIAPSMIAVKFPEPPSDVAPVHAGGRFVWMHPSYVERVL